MRPGRVVDHLPLNGAKVKCEKNYTPTPPVCHLDIFQGDLYLLQNIQIVSGAHAASCSMGSGASFSGLKRPRPHLQPKFKYQWGYTSVPPCDFVTWREGHLYFVLWCHGVCVAFVSRMEVRHTPLDVNTSLLLCEAGKRFEPQNVKDVIFYSK